MNPILKIRQSDERIPVELQDIILDNVPKENLGKLASVCKLWKSKSDEAYQTNPKFAQYKIEALKINKIKENEIHRERKAIQRDFDEIAEIFCKSFALIFIPIFTLLVVGVCEYLNEKNKITNKNP